jgi:thermitase
MKAKLHKQVPRFILSFLFLCALLWNVSAGTFQTESYQGVETATGMETSTEANLEDNNGLETRTQEQAPRTFSETPSSPKADQATPISTEIPPESDTLNSVDLPPEVVTGAHVSDEVIVKFKPSTRFARIQECLDGTQTSIASEIEGIGALVLKVPDGGVGRALPRVRACAGVLYVEPNYIVQVADTIPNDSGWGNQWGLVNIRALQGWDLSTGSTAVTIAIVDTGVDLGHPDLAGKMLAGYDFVNGDTNPQDDNGHGTHVAGIAAAISNNGVGVTGVSWGARILPVKVLNAVGNGFSADTAAGIVWAADHGAQVINLSLGGANPSSAVEDAVNYAYGKGVILVAATGNSGENFILYPARYPNVIAVGATYNTNSWVGSSNFGPEVDLAAPGAGIYSTVVGGYNYNSGTSMATAFVSGLAAVLRGIPGNASPDVIAWQMESTALDIEFAGWDEYTGHGLIQMDAAIQRALPQPIPAGAETKSPSLPQYNQALPSPTFTLLLTYTETPTLIVGQQGSDTSTPSSTPTGEPGIIALEIAREEFQEPEGASPALLIPCLGLILIILGIILFWISAPLRRKGRHRSIKS